MADDLVKNITFSFDDGSREDLRLLELLNRYNLKGTFYVPKNFRLRTLTDADVKLIARTQEIGGHTLHHQTLTELSPAQQRKEIFDSKKYLEELTGKKVGVMSYPNGPYNADIIELLKEAGYLGARTVKRGPFSSPNSFELAVTLQFYPFPLRKKDKNSFLWGRYLFGPLWWHRDLTKYLLPISFLSWKRLSRNSFDYINKHGGTLHFWGHGWEIEKYGFWQEVEAFLKYVSGRDDVEYVTNGELVKKLFYEDTNING
ncbi:polysaccharide deacetylase family protein [Patescibacteria group bacterium]|nr:polysaccharide deacetylase family protein [Patescibacteria group bacterium]MBU4511788.1 polysaccharide deacetylase family protein [Patescibacteria group bacterium]